MCKQLSRSLLFTFYRFGSILLPFWNFFFCKHRKKFWNGNRFGSFTTEYFLPYLEYYLWCLSSLLQSIKTPFMYIDHIWPFTTFISRNKHNKNIRLRLYWLRLRCKLLIICRSGWWEDGRYVTWHIPTRLNFMSETFVLGKSVQKVSICHCNTNISKNDIERISFMANEVNLNCFWTS